MRRPHRSSFFRLARTISRVPGLSRSDGFSLLEILIVLAIIGLVAGLAITKIGNIFDNAKRDAAQLFVSTSLKLPLNAYKLHVGDYPSTAEGLEALVTAPTRAASRWHGSYLESDKVPLDPWNEPYQYIFPGTRNKNGYDVWSKGPDHQSGTEDDIGNWTVAPPAENK